MNTNIANMDIITIIFTPLSLLLIVLLLTMTQSFFVNRTQFHIAKISYHHPRLYKVLNWWGTFMHELSHALIVLISLNKIKEFKVGSGGGHVTWSSTKKQGYIAWLSAQIISLAPFFIPPLLIGIPLVYTKTIDLESIIINSEFADPINMILMLCLELIPQLALKIGKMLAGLNLLCIWDVLLLIVLMFSFSGAKPSSIKDSHMEGDIQSFLRRCKEHPIYTFFCLVLLILAFWGIGYYSWGLLRSVYAFVIMLPILSVFALILNILFVEFVHRLDNTPGMYKIMPIVAFVGCYAMTAQFTANHYLLNGLSVGLLAGVLKLCRRAWA
jgi:hypothetical protein